MNALAEIQIIKDFLLRFSQLDRKLRSSYLGQELALLEHFLSNSSLIELSANRILEEFAPKFNLFEIMRIGHYEAAVHTPFLKNVLDPDGTHGQGRLFFDQWMGHVLRAKYQPDTISNIEVNAEYNTPWGIIDLLIRFNIGRRLFAGVVENKINALDQDKQLERYYTYLRQVPGIGEDNYLMIYLTKRGTCPEIPRSISQELYDKLKQGNRIREMSYQVEVVRILTVCLDQVKAPVVTETLNQYIRTIKEF